MCIVLKIASFVYKWCHVKVCNSVLVINKIRRKFPPTSFSFYWNMIYFLRCLNIPTIIFFCCWLLLSLILLYITYLPFYCSLYIFIYIFIFHSSCICSAHVYVTPIFFTSIYSFFLNKNNWKELSLTWP